MITEIENILKHELYPDQDVWCLTCGNTFETKSKEKQAAQLDSMASAEAPVIEGQIRCSEDVYQALCEEAANLDKECFWMVLLNAKNQIIEVKLVSMGSLTSSIVHPREVFKPAILASAASVILAHNHPSGNPTPSREDIELTRRLKEAGELIGIKVLDHIIIGDKDYCSMKEARYM